MAIRVTCPKCLKRFNVSDKFAGKKGPCPECKSTIVIPDKTEEVVIHVPEMEGPKDSKGRSILKPITRDVPRITRRGVLMVVGSIVAAIVAASVVRSMDSVPTIIPVLGALLLAPVFVYSGYSFAREQELEPFTGRELQSRVALCSVLFAMLWLLYAFVPAYVMDYKSVNQLPIAGFFIAVAVMVTIGSFIAVLIFELETGGGIVLSSYYVIGTLLLAMLAGIPMFAWN